MASIADLIRESTRDARRREMTHDDSFRRGQDLMRDTVAESGRRARKVGGAIDDALASVGDALLPRADLGSRYAVGYDEPMGKWEQVGDTPESAELKTIGALFPTGSLSDAAAGGKAVLRTFGGMRAKTADLEAQKLAEALEAKGVAPEKIWQETGWYRAPWDKKWRFEIDDSGAKWAGQGLGEASASRMVDHSELFNAYPNEGKLPMAMVGGRTSAYVPDPYEPYINIGAQGGNPLSLAAHELQHGIQAREGFANGGDSKMAFRDPRMWGKGAQGSDVARRMLDEKLKEMTTPMPIDQYAQEAWGQKEITPELIKDYTESYLPSKKSISPALEKAAQETVAKDWYRRLAGEAEARAVQARMNLTPEQRRARFPLEDFDVKPEDMIVRYGDGPAMNMPVDYGKLPLGAPELKTASIGDLHDALASMRARNAGKGLDEDMATGAIRDEIARRNAVEMLGLGEGNTAMDRAKKMGYKMDAYHGRTNDYGDIDLTKAGGASKHESANIPAFWAGLHPTIADLYTAKSVYERYPMGQYGAWKGRGIDSVSFPAGFKDGANTMPLKINYDNESPVLSAKEMDRLLFSDADDSRNAGHLFAQYAKNAIDNDVSMIRGQGHYAMEAPELRQGTLAVFDPSRVRSRFAAFDPARRNSANLLASLVGAAALASPIKDYLDK